MYGSALYITEIVLKKKSFVVYIRAGDTEVLNLTYCENTGMSFSLLEGQTLILILMPILLIGLIEWYIFSGRVKRPDVLIALSVVAGGGFGNLIDRAFQGYVVDFIDVRIINFAIFNFADICAVCGGIYFCIILLIEEFRDDKKKKTEEEKESNENLQATGEKSDENA